MECQYHLDFAKKVVGERTTILARLAGQSVGVHIWPICFTGRVGPGG
jgi:hypothetical protein